jgi:hypothetical protein
MSKVQQSAVEISHEDPKSETSPLIALHEGASTHDNETDIHENASVHALFPQRSWGHMCFIAITIFSIASLVLMALSQCLTVAVVPLELVQIVLRIYILLFCVISIVGELQHEALLNYFPSLDHWVYRGFLYSYTGLIGVEESHAVFVITVNPNSVMANVVGIMVKVPSYAMVTVGCFYMLLGLCCCHGVRKGIEDRYQKRVIDEIRKHQRDQGNVV